MKTKTLEVADSEHSLTELAEKAYQNVVPGFQVSPEFFRTIGLLAVLDGIEKGSARVLDAAVPFTHMPALWNEPGSYAPHIDASFRGLSVHHNKGGRGVVELSHLLDGTHQGEEGTRIFSGKYKGHYARYQGGGIEEVCRTESVPHGEVHAGNLEKDVLTVFSQGNMGDLIPAIHHFKRVVPGGSWVRYASGYLDGELSKEQLGGRAKNFRLGYLYRDFNSIFMDKHMLDEYPDEEPDVLLTSGYRPEEIAKLISTHPGRNIVPLGSYDEFGVEFRELRRGERWLHRAKSAIRDKVRS